MYWLELTPWRQVRVRRQGSDGMAAFSRGVELKPLALPGVRDAKAPGLGVIRRVTGMFFQLTDSLGHYPSLP